MNANTIRPLWDFATDFQNDPERALRCLQLLLLDERALRVWVAYLQALAEAGKASFPNLAAAHRPEDFTAELRLVCEGRLFPALREGLLTDEQVWRLHRFTCDPDALLEAHRRLNAEENVPPDRGGTRTPDDTSKQAAVSGFTALALAGNFAALASALEPWLPYLLRSAGLCGDAAEGRTLAKQFLAYLRPRLVEVRGRRFRELLPGWLRDFAREQQLSERLGGDGPVFTARDVEAAAVEQVLTRASAGEMPWATTFRESALRAQVPTARALLAFEPAATAALPAALPNYRRDLFVEVRELYRVGLRAFEFDLTV